MQEVTFPVGDVRRLGQVVGADRVESLVGEAEQVRDALAGAAVVCVSSTAAGGGVAEMLQRAAAVRAWRRHRRPLVGDRGRRALLAITKRLHNHLYGVEGDGGPLGEEEHRHYQAVMKANAAQLAACDTSG